MHQDHSLKLYSNHTFDGRVASGCSEDYWLLCLGRLRTIYVLVEIMCSRNVVQCYAIDAMLCNAMQSMRYYATVAGLDGCKAAGLDGCRDADREP
jgi:bacteriorhodopsin